MEKANEERRKNALLEYNIALIAFSRAVLVQMIAYSSLLFRETI
jgi:hypothetical protein